MHIIIRVCSIYLIYICILYVQILNYTIIVKVSSQVCVNTVNYSQITQIIAMKQRRVGHQIGCNVINVNRINGYLSNKSKLLYNIYI